MEKVKRGERLVAMARILSQNPNRVIPYQVFCDRFGAAKSSVSEDIAMIEKVMRQFDLGQVATVTGAAGGVRFRPMMGWGQAL
ncbi:MAG: pur operon repressor, partial [Clostridiales bacterium]|nr:pur operon repressor [Clostridiales bacterium]